MSVTATTPGSTYGLDPEGCGAGHEHLVDTIVWTDAQGVPCERWIQCEACGSEWEQPL